MRRILVDNARRERRANPLDAVDTIALDDALVRLEDVDPEQACIVELRFFGGLTVEETGAVLNVSPATIKREWAMARGWLY
jgi:DNA-directed RNA polymerase specialized sigma24 family protein